MTLASRTGIWFLASLAASSAFALAQDLGVEGPDTAAHIFTRSTRTQVIYDHEHGSIRALGVSYKASASPEGFYYVPFLGSDAPRNYPLTLRLDSATLGGEAIRLTDQATASRNGNRITMDRGPVDIWYDMSTESVEQSFSLNAGEIDHELVLTLNVETELRAEKTRNGIAYLNELGGVTYEHALVIDANGQRLELPIFADQNRIQLVVPAEFMAKAVAPIVVDPLLETYTINRTALDDETDPDIAYDRDSNTFAYAIESGFSTSDHDVLVEFRDASTGQYIRTTSINIWMTDIRGPRIASDQASNQFIITAQELFLLSGSDIIVTAIDAQNPGSRTPYLVLRDHSPNESNRNLDLGGKSQGSAGCYVVWESELNGNPTRVFGSRITPTVPFTSLVVPTASPVFEFDAPANTRSSLPVISKSSGKSDMAKWRVAFLATNLTTANQEIWSALIDDSAPASAPVTSSLANIGALDAVQTLDISEGIRYPRARGTFQEIFCLAVETQAFTSPSRITIWAVEGDQIHSHFILSELEHQSPFTSQLQPVLATVDEQFAITYVEARAGDYTHRMTGVTYTDEDEFGIVERRTPITDMGSSLHYTKPAAASRYSGGLYTSKYIATAVPVEGMRSWDVQGTKLVAHSYESAGSQYCIGSPNSSGDYAFIRMTGSASVTTLKTLRAEAMPQNQFGYFLSSIGGSGQITIPGSAGTLCIAGGPLGRYNAANQVFFTGASGAGELGLTTNEFRDNNGLRPGLAGETWNFQAWFRESGGTSNFTNAISVRLRL